jgi:hypothetical protein
LQNEANLTDVISVGGKMLVRRVRSPNGALSRRKLAIHDFDETGLKALKLKVVNWGEIQLFSKSGRTNSISAEISVVG